MDNHNKTQAHPLRNKIINNYNCLQINLAHSLKALQELRIKLYNSDIDIVFIQEPYLDKSHLLRNLPGYTIYQYSTNRPIRAALAIKENKFSTLGITEHSNSNLCIVQLNNKSGRKIMLTSVYIEPRSDNYNTISRLECFLQNTTDALHVIGGDYNAWHREWGSRYSTPRGNLIYNIFINYDLNLLNKGDSPTYETITHGKPRTSCIDLSAISNHPKIHATYWENDSTTCPSSDHRTLLFGFSLTNVSLSRNKKLSTYKYNTSAVKWEQIHDAFIAEIKKSLPNSEDIESFDRVEIDNYIKDMTVVIQTTCDKLLPRHRRYPNKAPWWNEDLDGLKQRAIQIHHKLSKLVKRNLPIDQILIERNQIRKEYHEAMNRASTNSFKEFCNNQKKEDVWSVTNRIMKTKPITQPPTTLKLEDGTYTVSPSETAAALINRFFPDDTPDVMQKQTDMRTAIKNPINTQPEPPFTQEEINTILNNMNHKRAPGQDGLTADICFQFNLGFPDIITRLLNRCLQLEYFPSEWKVAVAKIIPKPNVTTHNEPSAYRPIGLINVFAKLYEKLLINRLTYYLQKNQGSNNMQFGFKQQTSTIQAIHNVLNIIRRAKDSKEHILVASLDIKSAFNNAWWPAIFHRLRAINCPSNIYNTLISYTENRHVQLNFSEATYSKRMTRGCVQGSVCGPALWNLILDDLLDSTLPEGCQIQAYADDILLTARHRDPLQLENITNNALKQISDWGKIVKLEFGAQKTQLIGFTNKASKCKITMDNENIKFSKQIKYLGVIIDHKLNFIKHVEYATIKAKKLFYKLSTFIRPTWGVHPENVRTIYRQVIEPIICYAAGVWSDALEFKQVTKTLRATQRLFAIKCIQGFRTVSTAAAISIAQLIPLDAKIRDVADVEIAKLRGFSSFLPSDLPLEVAASPGELLHPAHRNGITFREIASTEDFNKIDLNNYHNIYTDGSKCENRVGAACVVFHPQGKTLTYKLKLHNCCSVFQAELLAIHKAIEWIVQNKACKSNIFSDSKSSLVELQNTDSCNHFASRIHKNLHQANISNYTINFYWVKSHIGIQGNETADREAKAAATLHKRPDHLAIPISHIKYVNKTESNQKAKELFETPNYCTYTKSILSNYNELKQYLSVVNPNFAISQFLTNHGYHKEYLHRFKIISEPYCPCDKSTIQSMQHLIKNCPRFAESRNTHITAANIMNIDPYNIMDIISKETTIDSFHSHICYIVKSLKDFNK